jgi:hypothetical protein
LLLYPGVELPQLPVHLLLWLLQYLLLPFLLL